MVCAQLGMSAALRQMLLRAGPPPAATAATVFAAAPDVNAVLRARDDPEWAGATALCLACSGLSLGALSAAAARGALSPARGGGAAGGARTIALGQLSLGTAECVSLLLSAAADVGLRVWGRAHKGATPLLLAAQSGASAGWQTASAARICCGVRGVARAGA